MDIGQTTITPLLPYIKLRGNKDIAMLITHDSFVLSAVRRHQLSKFAIDVAPHSTQLDMIWSTHFLNWPALVRCH